MQPRPLISTETIKKNEGVSERENKNTISQIIAHRTYSLHPFCKKYLLLNPRLFKAHTKLFLSFSVFFFVLCVCLRSGGWVMYILYIYLRRYAIYATRKNSSYRIGQTIYSSIILLRFFHGIYLLICIFGILAKLSLSAVHILWDLI